MRAVAIFLTRVCFTCGCNHQHKVNDQGQSGMGPDGSLGVTLIRGSVFLMIFGHLGQRLSFPSIQLTAWASA
jgi:hypothetical protein